MNLSNDNKPATESAAGLFFFGSCSLLVSLLTRKQAKPLRSRFRLAAAAHAELGQNVTNVRLHGGELDVHDAADLGIALIRAQKAQDLQLRRRQRLALRHRRL